MRWMQTSNPYGAVTSSQVSATAAPSNFATTTFKMALHRRHVERMKAIFGPATSVISGFGLAVLFLQLDVQDAKLLIVALIAPLMLPLAFFRARR